MAAYDSLAAVNIALTQHAERPYSGFTVDDVRRMVEAGIIEEYERVELIEGELVAMASKGYAHDNLKDELAAHLVRGLPGAFRVRVESTLQLGPSVLVEPDILVCRRKDLGSSEEGFVIIEPGAVLLLIEIAASSMAYDRGRKALLYARHGIPAYWVIDANGRTTWMHGEPSATGYGSVREVAADGVVSAAELPLGALRLIDLE